VVTGYGLWVAGDFFELDDEGDQLALKYSAGQRNPIIIW